MSLLTSDGLLADNAGTSNHCIMNEYHGETKINVTNHEADKTNYADKSDINGYRGNNPH